MILQWNHHPAETKTLLNFCFRSYDVLSVTFWPCNKNRFAVFTNFSSHFLKHTGRNSQLDPTQPHTDSSWLSGCRVSPHLQSDHFAAILITTWSQTTAFPLCHCSIIKPNLRVVAIKDPTVIVGICKDSLLQLIMHTTFLLCGAEERCRKSNKASCIFIRDRIFLKACTADIKNVSLNSYY